MYTYSWSFLSVRYVKLQARTTSNQVRRIRNSATPKTPRLAMPTQSANSVLIDPEACPSLIIELHTFAIMTKQMNNSKRWTVNLFSIPNKTLYVSTLQCNHQYCSTERTDRMQFYCRKVIWYVCCL
jgi:hypothetical protein